MVPEEVITPEKVLGNFKNKAKGALVAKADFLPEVKLKLRYILKKRKCLKRLRKP